MDESALRMAIANFEASLASLHWWLEFFTALVVAGVVFEVVFVVWEFREGLHDFRRGIIHAPEKPSIWLLVICLFGSSLVAVGVSGEFWEEAKIEGIEKGARGMASAVASKAEELDLQLADAKAQLESVEAKGAELQKSLINLAVCNAPRVIPSWSMTDHGKTETAIDPLRPFAGTQAIIEYVPDSETKRAASNIASSLTLAGWKLIRISALDGIGDGVEIQPYMAELIFDFRYSMAADALIDFLQSYNWQAKWGFPLDENGHMIRDSKILPPDTVRIRVGLYPPVTYVNPPGKKDFSDAIARLDQQSETIKKQIETEQAAREEELLGRLTPQQASEYKARIEQMKKEDEQETKRSSGPCQSLDSLVPSLR